MKKIIAFALLSSVLVSLTACGSAGSGTAGSEMASSGSGAISEMADSSSEMTSGAAKAASEETEMTSSETAGTGFSADTQTEMTIFIAASLEKAFTEKIIPLYNESRPNVSIAVNSGSSGALQQQIEEGAACDLFFSAGSKQVAALEEKGLTMDGTRVDLLENEVVLVKRAGAGSAVTGFDTITKASSLALCADSVPAGQYARKIFENMGITDQVMAMTINECANVTAALSAVAEGSNEVGIVYASDAANEPGVEVIAKADSTQLPENPLYPVVLIKNAQASDEEKAAAADFEAFLQSDDAMKIFNDYTFIAHEA
jgi:molybdate transport system substrate-binding protein